MRQVKPQPVPQLRMKSAEWLKQLKVKQPGKRSKHGNKPVITEEGYFASQLEFGRWQDLKMYRDAGEITDLRRQVPYKIEHGGKLICTYIADAVYFDNSLGKEVIEDAKGHRTKIYRLKKKMLSIICGLEITEFPPVVKKPRKKKLKIKNEADGGQQ